MKKYKRLAVWLFNLIYLSFGAIYFIQDLNFEFVIYVGVLALIIGGVFILDKKFHFPAWQLWLLSLWGLLHVLGGAVQTADGVLFAYRIYPFFNGGGELYILKYDQLVHGYLYGVVTAMAIYILHNVKRLPFNLFLVFIAILISLGISTLNEIMEFLISLNLERHGVGGYENTLLDLMFNLGGAIIVGVTYWFLTRKI